MADKRSDDKRSDNKRSDNKRSDENTKAASVGDYMVTVCAECLTASCWHGDFYCSRYRSANLTERRASELAALGREHRDYFSPERIRAVTGSLPRPATGEPA
jgi:hypothetical protein